MHCIAPLMVDVIPERLELSLVVIFVQCVFLDLGCLAIFSDSTQSVLIEDPLNQYMDSALDVFHFVRKRSECLILGICTVFIRYMSVFVDIAI